MFSNQQYTVSIDTYIVCPFGGANYEVTGNLVVSTSIKFAFCWRDGYRRSSSLWTFVNPAVETSCAIADWEPVSQLDPPPTRSQLVLRSGCGIPCWLRAGSECGRRRHVVLRQKPGAGAA